MKRPSITAMQLLALLPDEELKVYGKETKVDYQVKKLSGQLVLKLLMYGLLSGKELSWRILEVLIHSQRFNNWAKLPNDFTTDHSSLAERVSKIEVSYFEKVFNRACEVLGERCAAQEVASYKLIRYDSTFVSIAASLLKMEGIPGGVNKSKQKDFHPVAIKFSVGFNGKQLKNVKMFHTREHTSDDLSLRELILEGDWESKEVAVFDRGLQSRKTFDEFCEQRIKFVTRLRRSSEGKIKHKKIRDITVIEQGKPIETQTLRIHQDMEVKLYGKTGAKTKNSYRMVVAEMKSDGKPIVFLTNIIEEISLVDITEIYRRRWDIEVFFKHIKQEFGFKHLLSRNENGIKVMLYMTLIAAMLIFVYRSVNQIEGFKIAKLWFINDLDQELMRILFQLCQQNPALMDYYTVW
jgi:Transposase DDE domain